jgi:hypothetical protein
VDDHTSVSRPERRETTQSFKDGEGFEEANVFLAMAARKLAREDGGRVVHGAQVGPNGTFRGVGPDVLDQKR